MEPGAVIGGKYRLVRRVGKGGMGTVWAAVHVGSGSPVAVKLLSAEAAASDEMRQRLLREAGAAGRVRHPNVVGFHEVGLSADGEPFLVMELLQGQTLRQLILERRRLDNVTALWIGAEVARALWAAHAAGIAHRDLKPSNVFLHRDADNNVVVKVLDFGVSKFLADEYGAMTSTGAAIGSPAYMSPEQAKGDRVDHRTDLWSFGVMMFEMLAGRRPFHADSTVALLSMILFGNVPRLGQVLPSADPVIDAIVARCLERSVSERYQQAEEVLTALDARRAQLSDAEAMQRGVVNAWVQSAAEPETALASAPEWSGPPSVGADSQSASQSGPQSQSASQSRGAGVQSSSTAHAVSASLPSPPAAPVPRRPAAAPRKMSPLLMLVVPGLAFVGLFVALIVLLFRSHAAPREPALEPPPARTAPPAPAAASVVEAPAPPTPVLDAASEAAPSASAPPAPVPKPKTTPQPVATPKPSPVKTPRPASKPCKSPIVDEAGKVIGCLD